MLRFAVFMFSVMVVLHVLLQGSAQAQATQPVSQCQAIARSLPSAGFVTLASGIREFGDPVVRPVAITSGTVTITYLGHSAFHIETPGGVSIVTDYNGWYKPATTPDVVTMNKAHSTHFTLAPDPAIRTVLHGWGDTPAAPADHDVVAGDTYIRNVTTDIRSGYGVMEPDGNSIFIFEVAGLCIGHLGHLHHELDETHYAQIGRLDVVMVPVDGGLTMGADSMSRVVARLRSALILPMHRRGPPVERFLDLFDPARFDRAFSQGDNVAVSLRSLPKKPLILVLSGV